MTKPLVSFSTDFGPGNKGHGIMKMTILERCPDAEVIELATNIQACDLRDGAKNFEAVAWLPKGIHICVVDPGVGTGRRGLVIETHRGDLLVGPDNGVLLPAAGFLGDIKKAYAIANRKYLRQPVSNVFHGRDVFASVAGHLAAGVKLPEIGPEIPIGSLVAAPYAEARLTEGSSEVRIDAEVIHLNGFGNVFFNVRDSVLQGLLKEGDAALLLAGKKKLLLPYRKTFGEVGKGKAVLVDDDFGRIEAALNQGNFVKKSGLKIGQKVAFTKARARRSDG